MRHTYIVGMPRNVAHTAPATHRHSPTKALHTSSHGARTTSIRERGNLALASQIPDNSVSGTARCRERVLYVMIPSESGDLIELRAARPRRIRFAWVPQVPNVNLPVDRARGEEIRLDRVEVEAAHGAGVRRVAEDERFCGTVGRITTGRTRRNGCFHSLRIRHDLRGVPDVELPVLHARDEHAARTARVRVAPC